MKIIILLICISFATSAQNVVQPKYVIVGRSAAGGERQKLAYKSLEQQMGIAGKLFVSSGVLLLSSGVFALIGTVAEVEPLTYTSIGGSAISVVLFISGGSKMLRASKTKPRTF